MQVLGWIQQVINHDFYDFNTVAIIPQARYATNAVGPFACEDMEYVVFVGYRPRTGTFVAGRIYRHVVGRGFFEWDNGNYDATDYQSAIEIAAIKALF